MESVCGSVEIVIIIQWTNRTTRIRQKLRQLKGIDRFGWLVLVTGNLVVQRLSVQRIALWQRTVPMNKFQSLHIRIHQCVGRGIIQMKGQHLLVQ